MNPSSRPPEDAASLAALPERDPRRFGWLEDLWLDLRFCARSLRQRGNRGFAVVAILTLALGIGSATAIFSVSYGFLQNSFPFKDVDGIWQPWINFPPNANANLTRVPRNFANELRKLPAVADVLESTFANGNNLLFIDSAAGGVEVYQNYLMGGRGFAFLGIPPLLGRTINESDIAENGAPADVVVLSYQAWKKFFPGDPNPLNKQIEFKDSRGGAKPKTVIGVMPERFGSQQNYEIGDTVWTPMPGANLDAASAAMIVRPRVRLKPGITREVAEQQVAALYAELAKSAPTNAGFTTADPSGNRTPREFKTTLRDFVSSTFDPQGVVKRNLGYLGIGVGLLLLIACMNVANLQLARAAARSKEISLRLALGAARGRLIRQLLTESVVLALAGAAVGILLAFGFTRGVMALLPPNTFGGAPLPSSAAVGIDGMVLLFAVLVAIVSGVLFGLAPALQSTRAELNDALKDGSKGSAGTHGAKIRSTLVIAEIAFSIILLVVASVTLWGYVRMTRISPGFNPDKLYLMAPGIPATDGRAVQLYERTQTLPFIESVGRAFAVGNTSRYTVEGKPKDDTKQIRTGLVDAGFLHTAGITLIRGRNFEPGEVARGDAVALIGDVAADLWPAGVDPIGKKITVDVFAPNPAPAAPGAPPNPPAAAPTLTVIGIISTLRPNLAERPEPFVLVPYMLKPGGSMFAVRVKPGETPPVQMEIQKIASTIDKNIRVNMQDMAAQFDTQFALPRFNFALFCSLALIALILAVAGIYSVLSYHIAQRTREFGVRLALGAEHGSIIRLVLGTGGRLFGFGLIAGLGGSLALGRILANQTQIFRVDLSDVSALGVTFAVLAFLAVAALAACYLPARRATRIDPLTALRAE